MMQSDPEGSTLRYDPGYPPLMADICGIDVDTMFDGLHGGLDTSVF
jgi:hypothetical protein